MFETGTYIVCGQHGVCRVESVGKLQLTEASGDKEYYTLSKVYSRGGVLYVPADSEKVVMRPVISREEAEELIGHIKEIDMLQIDNEKRKEEIFKQAFKTCDSREWVKVIKTLYERKKIRLSKGKKVTASDERYLRTAEDNLYGELAISLNIDKNDVEQYIMDKIGGVKK
ncbi:MAG: CarD family transcriptional regulator [Dorea sp.]|jgi:CarD family transcriptional regulator|nr:CarD family transcriptional regulator [Dorea sp.]